MIMKIIKKNLSLLLGLSIPFLMILFVAGSVYLPGLFIKPRFDFLYASGANYNRNGSQYSVQNGKLIKNKDYWLGNQNDHHYRADEKLYIYDVIKKESKEIYFEQAQHLILDSNVKSPDGFEIVYGSSSGFFSFLFGSGKDYSTRYLTGYNTSQKLNIQLIGNNYYSNFHFLGWVK